MIYSRLLREKNYILSGEINDATANTVIAQLFFLNQKIQKDISLYINTPGGSVTSGLAIIDTMNHIKPSLNHLCRHRGIYGGVDTCIW